MGLDRGCIHDLIQLGAAGHLRPGSRVVEIGAQQLSNDFLRAKTALGYLYRQFDRPVVDFGDPLALRRRDDSNVEAQSAAAPWSSAFWRSLGLSYCALDYDGQGGSIPFDLNRDAVPDALRSSFDLLVNSGTTEHVANQDNAFRVIHDLVKPGGVMLHLLPAGGMLTHGLVSYTLQFFWLLCRENRYEVLDLQLRAGRDPAPIPPNILDSNKTYGRFEMMGRSIAPDLAVPILYIHAVLRKPGDAPYVTMLDMPT